MASNSQRISFVVNGSQVVIEDDGASLLEILRDRLGIRSPKDGCSPQGQCGCCTIWVDGKPRVSCVTPIRRLQDREVITLEGLGTALGWTEALSATGGSQCGFCTPGIIMRLASIEDLTETSIREALKAHLCRCTGWQTIVEAAVAMPESRSVRSLNAAEHRASLEGGCHQQVGAFVAAGLAGFADDVAPNDALVAVRSADGDWVLGETVTEARAIAGNIQGRRSTIDAGLPITLPEGEFQIVLQTSWVEPGYLETDASWCVPGGEPATSLANGGAFGSKMHSEVGEVARRLANERGRSVRVLYSREDSVRLGFKRPPIAAGVRSDGSGVMHVAATPGITEAVYAVAPDFEVIEVEASGPPTSSTIRGAGWVEALVLRNAVLGGPIITPAGAEASATFDGSDIAVTVSCGAPLDEVTLRSYCIGAAHMAYSWVTSESLSVSDSGDVLDLTVRSFGIVRAKEMPSVDVTMNMGSDKPVNGSDAVFAAVAAAVWRHAGYPGSWPLNCN